ncbi:MAG: isoleucine--tRNA ligase [Armatimonadota bacterium]
MDYRDTLNLLRTDFPMRGNLAEREPQILRMWQEMDIYEAVRELRAGSPTYILHDGPPYANGDIHLGQALNKILKDITIKYKTMRGFDCPYIPGWDTQGLPTEQSVQREKNVFPHDVPVLQWRRMCRELALGYVDTQREQFKRIGVRGDWDDPYLTLSPDYQALQIEAFGKIALAGLLYRALRPVYWCYHCETALAEDEIEYVTRTAPAIYVAFEVIDAQELPMDQPPSEPVSFLIWTTTPWTIPGNTAIALSETAEYVLVDTPKGHFILAQELLDRSMAECQIGTYQVVARFTGAELEGLVTRHPMYDRESPVVLADYVTVEDGTGAVHTAPGHGLEDYETALAYDLDIVSPLDDLGRYTDEAGEELAGNVADQSNEIVTGILSRKGALIGEIEIEHEYPHCWRCHEPVIYRATRQWFMDIARLRGKALEAVKGVQWNPEWGESRISGMIESRPDWCISRQRTWGVPIPVFYCTECGEPLITRETIEHLRDLVARHGADVWWEREAEELLPENTVCQAESCGGTNFRKEPDIMSVWVDSGCSHYCVVRPHPELSFPADLYLEGDDQYQCWFQTSLWVAMALGDPAPYRTVVGHGFFVDETGQKLSKSRGNIISPAEIYDQYGADVLRLWFTYADFRQKMMLSDSIFKQVADAYRRIRNTVRFLLQNLQDFDPSEDSMPAGELREIDRWALDRLQRRIRAVTEAYERWDLHIVYRELHAFCDRDLSAFYLNVLKDRIYTDLAESPARRSAQTAMWRTLIAVVKMMAPVLTFTSEEVWQHMRREVDEALPASVQLADWPEVDEGLLDEDLARRYSQFLEVRGVAMAALEEAKASGEVPNPVEARLDLYVSDAVRNVLEGLEEDLWSLFIVSDVELHHLSEAEEELNEPSGMHAEASLAAGDKCARCWLRAESTGMVQEHPELCSRCAERVNRILSG